MAAGAVYDPLLDEMYTATAGTGAFRNGERIGGSNISDLRKGRLATGFAYDVKLSADNNFDYFRAFVFTGRRSPGTAPPRSTCATWPAGGSTASGS
jgi:myo-inositol-1(or 4)-monophosphatase